MPLLKIMPAIWLGLAVLACVIEASTAQMVSIWFAAGAVVTFIVSLFSAPIPAQVIIFIAVSIVVLVASRPLVKKYIQPKIVKTNADAIIGKTAVVISPVSNLDMKGRVSVSGLDWAAISEDEQTYQEGEQVVVQKIDGVKLIVSKK
ncbi:MAG: NfeD family protein [Oscillospiraceae bacterium]|nr:NfeD family protein [Oscillospiraceae bacterium]